MLLSVRLTNLVNYIIVRKNTRDACTIHAILNHDETLCTLTLILSLPKVASFFLPPTLTTAIIDPITSNNNRDELPSSAALFVPGSHSIIESSTVPATRNRSDLELDTETCNSSPSPGTITFVIQIFAHSLSKPADSERARKRQRIERSNSASLITNSVMRKSESDQDSLLSVSPEAGPSSMPGPSSANGHSITITSPSNVANGNGFLSSSHNGLLGHATSSTTNGLGLGNGVIAKNGKSPVVTVNLPGTKLYEGTDVDREEFIRLVIQSLREVGYM